MSLLDDVLPHITPTWRTAREIAIAVGQWSHTSIRHTLREASKAGTVESRSVPLESGHSGQTVWQFRLPQ